MHAPRWILLATLVACLGAALPAAPGAAAKKPPAAAANALVATIDTGINPYHVVFRDHSPRARKHPSTYIPGYPTGARPLRISFGEADYPSAVRKDCRRVWSKVEPGQLYYFPGTKIVGAITFQDPVPNCSSSAPTGIGILDYGGHGTMVASRAASTRYGACRECLVVAVQGFSTTSVGWAASQASWIDAQSNSWGPITPVWEPTGGSGLLANHPEFVKTVEAAARKHLAFWASGNGAATRGGVLGHPTLLDPRMTPSIIMTGGHDSGYINLWPDFPPHVISDSCNSWAAYHNKIKESADDVGGGTSGASPYAAGGATRMLLEARRILGDANTGVEKGLVAKGGPGLVKTGPLTDGKFTLDEWRDMVKKTATARPVRQHEDGSVCDLVGGLVLYSSTPVQWKDVPPQYPEYLHIGYGAVDDASHELAVKVLRGKAAMPDRSQTDRYFALDAQARAVMHDIYGGP